MKSIANLLFEFALFVENGSTGEIKGCAVLPHIYEEIKEPKSIVIVDVSDSEPKPSPNNQIRDYNALLAVEILVLPILDESTGRYDFLTAREKVKSIADEFIDELYKHPHINSTGENICQIQVLKKRDTWTPISTVRYAISTILLKANSN